MYCKAIYKKNFKEKDYVFFNKRNEQEKERKESLIGILGQDLFDSMEKKGKLPSYIGRVRSWHCGESKDFPLIGFGEKRPMLVVANNQLVQLSI